MGTVIVNKNKCDLCGRCVDVCPFNAIEIVDGRVEINASCRVCRLCIKQCPMGAIAISNVKRKEFKRDEWKGIMVFVEHMEGNIHPVTFELAGKARELADRIGHPVYAVFVGRGVLKGAAGLSRYGIDRVYVYDHEELEHYRADVYANVFEQCIKEVRPSIVLVGATSTGRSLAPRVATRFGTGLTADCTALDIRENTDLVQIRPAFGGNIMAQIITGNSRPQFATVRYKVMNRAECLGNKPGMVEKCKVDTALLKSGVKVLGVRKKEKQPDIADANIIVAAGRGIKNRKDIALLEELAGSLGGQVGATRGLVEDGWMPYTSQIGLSGRTVKPELIITCGVSGAVQFSAGMKEAGYIFAINIDRNAPIFEIAHYGIVGDLYEVVPGLIERIKKERVNNAV